MRLPGGWEWIIVLFIVLLLFGPGRIGKMAGELGKSIKAFRDGIAGDNKDEEQTADSSTSSNNEPK
jgi:sec-independent protein translocase protein TatA